MQLELDYAVKVLKEFVERDRMLRDNSTESDYDKFCETTCSAIETVLNNAIFKEDILKKIKEINSPKYSTGRTSKDTLEFGIKMGKLQVCKELLEEKGEVLLWD